MVMLMSHGEETGECRMRSASSEMLVVMLQVVGSGHWAGKGSRETCKGNRISATLSEKVVVYAS